MGRSFSIAFIQRNDREFAQRRRQGFPKPSPEGTAPQSIFPGNQPSSGTLEGFSHPAPTPPATKKVVWKVASGAQIEQAKTVLFEKMNPITLARSNKPVLYTLCHQYKLSLDGDKKHLASRLVSAVQVSTPLAHVRGLYR